MDLFIRIQDGQPFEHPILGENFRQVFSNIDTNNLPPEFARFERLEPPILNAYEVYEGVTYEWSGEAVKDVHHVRPMTEQEKTAKQNEVKTQWAEYGFASWVFNEETCSFEPPVLYPEGADPHACRWDEETTSWKEVQ
jgi:hypothetical protein